MKRSDRRSVKNGLLVQENLDKEGLFGDYGRFSGKIAYLVRRFVVSDK